MTKGKDKDKALDIVVCEGIKLSKSIYETKENRLFTLLIKGFVVYLLSMGSIGFYLSAFSTIEYNVVLCHVVIFIMAMFSALIYYRLLTENVGYLIVLILFCILVYKFRTYINSGFYAIVNTTVDGAAQYFNIDIQRVYNEQIEDRYVTVTFAVLFIGIVLDIFLNVYISRRMQYVTAIFAIMGLNMIPLYLINEPSGGYVAMVLGGMALAYVYRSGKHYSPQVSIKRDDIKFKEKGKKHKEIAYVYDAKAMVNAGVIALAIVVVMVPVISAFKPKENFNVGYQGNKYKELTMAAVSTVLMDGLSGFFKMSEDVGGLENGKLGEVSTIRLDHKTDLVVQLVPYENKRIYLKGFTGVKYNPYANTWTNVKNSGNLFNVAEAESLREYYLDGYEYSAETIVRINNVENDKMYQPYYGYEYEYTEDSPFMEVLTYPRLEENKSYVEGEYYGGPAFTDADLYVPPENVEAIEEIVGQLNYPITQEQMIQSLIDFYQENFPYTIQPGKTPYRKDFVNDFLTEKQKGYCTHYASAAVLIYRYLGIPARYVEGYAIDMDQVYNGELVYGAYFSDYYKGYSALGDTALLEIEVTDADAHAWVEVYDVQKGWHPVEVTPYATIEEEEQEDFWTMFADMYDDSEEHGDDAISDVLGRNAAINKAIRNVVYGLGIILALIISVFLCIKLGSNIKYFILFCRAGINDKLIFKYQRICRKLRKRDKEFRDMLNYRQQIEYLVDKKQSSKQGKADIESVDLDKEVIEVRKKIISILEKAGFSQETISKDEYAYAIEWCKKFK